MPRIFWVLAIWALIALSAQAQLPAVLIPDSCLNADTLQITSEYFQPVKNNDWGKYPDELNRVWITNVGNRMVLLQNRRFVRGELMIGKWSYCQVILGVFIAKKPEQVNKATFSYIKLKSNNSLRKAIPEYLEQKFTSLRFRW